MRPASAIGTLEHPAAMTDTEALQAATLEAVVCLVKVHVLAERAGGLHRGSVADLCARTLLATTPEVAPERVRSVLEDALTAAEAPVCARCHVRGAALHAFGLVPGARCNLCWQWVFDGVTGGDRVGAPQRARLWVSKPSP